MPSAPQRRSGRRMAGQEELGVRESLGGQKSNVRHGPSILLTAPSVHVRVWTAIIAHFVFARSATPLPAGRGRLLCRDIRQDQVHRNGKGALAQQHSTLCLRHATSPRRRSATASDRLRRPPLPGLSPRAASGAFREPRHCRVSLSHPSMPPAGSFAGIHDPREFFLAFPCHRCRSATANLRKNTSSQKRENKRN